MHLFDGPAQTMLFLSKNIIQRRLWPTLVVSEGNQIKSTVATYAFISLPPHVTQAEVLARRAMSCCLNPNDPKIATVVTNAKEMETALLIAKVLETSALLFNAGNGKKSAAASSGSEPRNPQMAESVSQGQIL